MIFEGGVTACVGASNLMMSHLPDRVLKVIGKCVFVHVFGGIFTIYSNSEFYWFEYEKPALAGISGSREVGIKYLERSTSLVDSPRFQLAATIVLCYNIYLESVFGIGDINLEWTERLCKQLLERHPNGGIVKFMAARTCLTRGRIGEAIDYYQQCLSLDSKWKPIDDISKWDLCAAYGWVFPETDHNQDGY